jgi:hypothetical protein
VSKEYSVHIRSTVSYEFTVEVDADSEEEAMQIADDNYWQDDYHGEARASQMHDEFEIVSATEIVQEDDSMDDDDDFPGRE